MISPSDITFVIPAYNLKAHRINNLKFILPFIIGTNSKVLLVEQVKENKSELSGLLSEIINNEWASNFSHLLYIHDSDLIHKPGIINWATKNHVDTKYVWVNDVDFYMKYAQAFQTEWTEDFIQPYSVGKKLSENDTNRIINGEKISVSYDDMDSRYISMYGALSFIFDKERFLSIGGMDESLYGWGKEDVELSRRVEENHTVQKIELKGIHLYHPIETYLKNNNSTNVDMAVVTCHFNWGEFINPVRNLHRFIMQMKIDNIPLYGVELSLTEKFETAGMDGWKQIKVDKENIFFQKEACINLAEKIVPSKYTKIAWIDHDLHFTNKNWYSDASKKLDEYKVVQLFSHGIKTDRYGKQTTKSPGAIFSYINAPKKSKLDWIMSAGDIGYPGGALAARRELWQYGGLYPYRVMGGGDTAFIMAMLKPKMGLQTNELFTERHNTWKKQILEYVGGSVSYIDGEFIHEWHGDVVNRKYVDRYSIIKQLNTKNIELNEHGIVHNYGDRTINQNTLIYFKNRNEDGIVEEHPIQIPNLVVYTCIVGKYDVLKEVAAPEKNIEYICFTDQIVESKTWKIKPIPAFLKSMEPAKIARCVKILPHLFLQEYNISVWVDGSIQILGGIQEFVDNNLKNYFAIPKHPDRVCVYEEAKAIVRLNKDSVEVIDKQIFEYKKKNYPADNGMVQSGIMIRKHNDKRCITIAELWWKEVREYSKRDQMSFNYSIWKKNVVIDVLNPNIIVGKNFQIWTHIDKGYKKVVLKDGYGDMKNYMNGVEV